MNTDQTEYDYVVVGGGSAGCAIASRLSEDPSVSVCLLEAGHSDWNPLIHFPSGILALVRGWFCNWRFWSEPQKHLNNRRLFQPRGKVLGGSSAINGTVYARGHKDDYDHWEQLGNEGWSYQDVLPFFRKSERFEPYGETANAELYHGNSGPLNVARRRQTNPASYAFVKAGTQAGYKVNNDFNGEDPEGVGLYDVYQQEGRRCSNATAYLKEARSRANLTIITRAHATGLIIEDKTAKGVQFQIGKQQHQVKASKEVIVSAGTFQSPQLLMLSGIGPEKELQQFNIPVKNALPGVGENLQDHMDVFVETKSKSKVLFSLHPFKWPSILWNLVLYVLFQKGSLTSNVAEAGGYFKTSEDEKIPDMQWHFLITMNAKHGLDLMNVFKNFGFSVMNYDLRPLSRGRVGLKSADPFAPPLIDPNMGEHERDIEKLIKGVKETRRVLSQKAMAPYSWEETSPGKHVQTDEQMREWVKNTAEVAYHPVGTCKMGSKDDPMAVVDSRLRVHGVNNLRVADCSIMPTLVGGNTNQPATMIGEKAAQMIAEDNA